MVALFGTTCRRCAFLCPFAQGEGALPVTGQARLARQFLPGASEQAGVPNNFLVAISSNSDGNVRFRKVLIQHLRRWVKNKKEQEVKGVMGGDIFAVEKAP